MSRVTRRIEAPFSYAVAVALVLLTLLSRWLLGSPFVDHPALLLFVVPILLSAYLGGLRPGLLATACSALASIYVVYQTGPVPDAISLADGVMWAVLLVTGILISLLNEALHRSIRRVEESERRDAELLVRQREAEARQAEAARFQQFTEKAPLGIVSGSLPGIIRSANDEFLRIVGRSREDVDAGRLRCDMITPLEWRDADRQAVSELDTSRIVRYEKELERPDGSRVPVMVGLIALGESLTAFVLDLSREKAAERELRESELKFRTLAEHARAVFGIIQDNRFVYANRYIAEVTGYSMAEILSMDFIQLVHPAFRALAADRARRRQTGESLPDHYELMIVTKNGEGRWIDLSSAFIEYRGRPAVIGTGFDITERKRAEQYLRESEERFRLAVESARLLAWEYNPISGRLSWTNPDPSWGRHGRTRANFDEFEALVHSEDLARVREGVRHMLDPAGSGQYSAEFRFLRADGQYRWLTARGQAFFEGEAHQRRAVRCLGISVDNTERKAAEEEIAAAREKAERARVVAEEASQAKDRFLAMLSHELRTPLTPVLASVSMLQKDLALDPRMLSDLEMIRRNVELEARLIDDLLDLTRIARGKIELDKQPIDLGTVISRAVEVCRADLDARGMQVAVDLGPAPYVVEGDASRLQQVFWNLLKNSIKFTPHGGCVGIHCEPEGGTEVVAQVRDSGIGIEPDDLKRIFDAFAQVEPSPGRRFGGLGLGLSISKSLVELHGGTIAARSPGRGKGATFEVRLPLLVPARGASQVPAWVASPCPASLGPAGGARVLLVEDHGDTAEMMKRMLELQGHEVCTAGDVATALQVAGEGRFDLLISDLGLPDGSGLDLLRELRGRGNLVPGIALSGYGQEHDVQQSREIGFAAHVVKPVDMERLRAAIEKVLCQSPAA